MKELIKFTVASFPGPYRLKFTDCMSTNGNKMILASMLLQTRWHHAAYLASSKCASRNQTAPSTTFSSFRISMQKIKGRSYPRFSI